MNKVRLYTDRNKIWQAVRIVEGEFDSLMIERLTETNLHNVQRYLRILADAGYLRRLRKQANSSGKGAHWIYRLIKRTGILPPIQKSIKYLYDPNNDEYWIEDPEEVRNGLVKTPCR